MSKPDQEPYGDPLTVPFWEAASRRELVMQKCDACGGHQFYPRPFCLACDAEKLHWAPVSGLGRIYSVTKVWRQAFPDHPAPYFTALVDLDEGPRLMTSIIGEHAAIGDRVRLAWRERADAPPLPVFEPIGEA